MTEATQSGEEYRRNQDITAPPDPVEPGSTTDVPLRGEKTNVLFHPTPSVSYEPMYAIMEKQAGGVCITLFVAVVLLGRLFGGRLVGLVPLAMCVTSGVWLWMKEVVRSGREVEWSSEKQRGQMVRGYVVARAEANGVGSSKSHSGIGGVDECAAQRGLGDRQSGHVPDCG
jgi:hypothetical protein